MKYHNRPKTTRMTTQGMNDIQRYQEDLREARKMDHIVIRVQFWGPTWGVGEKSNFDKLLSDFPTYDIVHTRMHTYKYINKHDFKSLPSSHAATNRHKEQTPRA